MLADIQRTVYPEEVTRQLHAMAQARERPTFYPLCYANCTTDYFMFYALCLRLLHVLSSLSLWVLVLSN